MTVAVYVPFIPHGGSLKNLQQLLAVWKTKTNNRIVVVAPQKALAVIGAVIGQGAVEALAIPPNRSFGLKRLAFERWGAAQLLKTVAPDVIFAPGGTLPDGLDVPAVANFQNVLPIQPDLWRLTRDPRIYLRQMVLRQNLRHAMRKTDIAIFNSESARLQFEEFYRDALPHNVVIPRAVATTSFDEREKADFGHLGVEHDYFITVGQIYAYRNLASLIRGYHAYARSCASPLQLVIIGRFGSPSEMRRVKAAIVEQPGGKHILLLGNQPQETTLSLLRRARIHLFSSSIENCPNVLLEAMALGTPTICARASANPEFGQDAVVYVNPRIAQEWTDALRALADDAPERNRLSERGKAVTAGMAGVDELAHQTWSVLQSAAGQAVGALT